MRNAVCWDRKPKSIVTGSGHLTQQLLPRDPREPVCLCSSWDCHVVLALVWLILHFQCCKDADHDYNCVQEAAAAHYRYGGHRRPGMPGTPAALGPLARVDTPQHLLPRLAGLSLEDCAEQGSPASVSAQKVCALGTTAPFRTSECDMCLCTLAPLCQMS
jgi:hypothetical protein